LSSRIALEHGHGRQLGARLTADGFDAELETHRTSHEHPATIIAAAARRHEADAIVLATRGRAPAIGLLTSSVTQRLLHIAPCPVIAVTPARRTRCSDGSPGRSPPRHEHRRRMGGGSRR
jgi:nucleotide-binding universal stress UspA family protein